MSKPNSVSVQRVCKDCAGKMPRAASRHFCKSIHSCKRCSKPMPKRKPSGYCSFECFKPPAIYKCEQCSAEFRGKPGLTSRFCSRDCYEENRRESIIHTCEGCGQNFRRPNWIGREYRFCSRRCSTKSQVRIVDLTCSHCQKPFQRRPSFAKAKKPYCSDDCRNQALSNRVIVQCEFCKTDFSVTKFFTENNPRKARFCSMKCRRHSTNETWIEKAVRIALESLNLSFLVEYPIQHNKKNNRRGSFYFIDFYLPDFKVAIEADGIYWHQKRAETDRKRDLFLTSIGITVIRITDEEIKAVADTTAFIVKRLGNLIIPVSPLTSGSYKADNWPRHS